MPLNSQHDERGDGKSGTRQSRVQDDLVRRLKADAYDAVPGKATHLLFGKGLLRHNLRIHR